MSMLESGYGFTRTAQFANNLFGWKAPQTDHGQLCPHLPAGLDPGNHYRRFPNWAGNSTMSVDDSRDRGYPQAVRERDHRLCARERAAGTQVPEAVLHWVQRIQQGGCNPDPSYVGRVVRIANNYPVAWRLRVVYARSLPALARIIAHRQIASASLRDLRPKCHA
ncbi:MAG: glucosaminidase domain-containing protein [Rhodospirillales bacterium]|nr:glucosaminidase domain-containing protein [Rhodospirillales bacterium]